MKTSKIYNRLGFLFFLLISSAAIIVSVDKALEFRQIAKMIPQEDLSARVETSKKDKCLDENPNNKVPGRVKFTVKVGTTNKRIIEITKSVGSTYPQPVSGRISNQDNPGIERSYTIEAAEGVESQVVEELLKIQEVKVAERLLAWCDRL